MVLKVLMDERTKPSVGSVSQGGPVCYVLKEVFHSENTSTQRSYFVRMGGVVWGGNRSVFVLYCVLFFEDGFYLFEWE